MRANLPEQAFVNFALSYLSFLTEGNSFRTVASLTHVYFLVFLAGSILVRLACVASRHTKPGLFELL